MRFDYGTPTVFIADYDLALEAYNGDACNNRPISLIPGFRSIVDKVHEDLCKYVSVQ